MRFAIAGAGGIGCLLGASLVAAGNDVIFIARGPHLAAMQSNGLHIESARGPAIIRPVHATDDVSTIGAVDLVLLCVKLWDLESAATILGPIMSADTVVIPLQNGIDASERIAPILGANHVLGGVARLSGTVVAPGVVRQSGTHHGIVFGELDGSTTTRVEHIQKVCAAAGISAIASNDIQAERWSKFVLIVASALCAITRCAIGEIRDDPDIAPLFDALMQEVVAVGRAKGVRLTDDVFAKANAFFRSVPHDTKPSMTVDLLAGNRLELQWLSGKVIELGKELGVPTPINSVIYGALKPHMFGAHRSAS